MELKEGEEGPKTEKTTNLLLWKKKCHTLKNICITDMHKRILLSTKTYPGKEHDKTISLNEDIFKYLPDGIEKLFDLGFYGIQNNLPELKNVIMPKKT